MAFTRPKAAQIDFDITNITDPLIRLNSGETGSADKDVGIVIERGDDTNVAIIYDETADQFVLINTTEDGSTSGNITISSYAGLQADAIVYGSLNDGTTTLTATVAELNYVDGVTSAIQTQLDAKVGETGSTGSAELPAGTTAQRDGSPSAGYIRFNTTDSSFEGYDGSSWGSIGSGGGGGLSNIVEDTTPQLGGNLDAQSNNITSLGTVNTHTIPGGTGTFALTSDITLSTLSITATAAELNVLDGITATTAELNYTDGVTSAIQTQLDGKLTLSGGTMTGTIAAFESTGIDDNASSTAVTIDSSGNVGIGTASPRAKLHTYYGSADDSFTNLITTYRPNIVLEDLSASAVDFQFFVDGNALQFRYGDASTDTKLATEAMRIDSSGNVGINQSSPATILHTKAGSNTETDWIFTAQNNAGTAVTEIGGYGYNHNLYHKFWINDSEKMRIDSSGNVGIGTTSPTYNLSIGADDNGIYSDADGMYIVQNTSNLDVLSLQSTGIVEYRSDDDDNTVQTGHIFYTDGSEAVRIDSSGNVGIGTSSPNRALGIVAANNVGGFEVTVTDNVADQTLYANLIDYNLSGSDTTTADRTHIGLRLDIDSSASGGDTSNEHRIYGIWNDIDVSADSDIVWGTYSSVRTTHSSGTISDMRGAYNVVEADGTGTVSSAYGSWNYALSGTTVSGLTNGYGSLNKYLKQAADTSTVTSGYGVYAEVEIDGGTITNAFGVRSIIDRDGGTVTNGYLYRGEYQGTYASGTQWGVYLTGEQKSYFSGDVGIGTTSPATELDVNGTVTATTFDGVATSAQYADLAERYEADAEYPAGTVMIFGGEKEVTQSTTKMDRRKAGVVSEKPAYMMNCDLVETVEYAPYIALQGRVPVRVIGEVRKGDLMITSSLPGCAEAWREEGDPRYGSVIGKALANKTTTEEELIEVVVGVI